MLQIFVPRDRRSSRSGFLKKYIEDAKREANLAFVGNGGIVETMQPLYAAVRSTGTTVQDLLRSDPESCQTADEIETAIRPWGSLAVVGFGDLCKYQPPTTHAAIAESCIRRANQVGGYALYTDIVDHLLAIPPELTAHACLVMTYSADALQIKRWRQFHLLEKAYSIEDASHFLVEEARHLWNCIDYAFWASGCGGA